MEIIRNHFSSIVSTNKWGKENLLRFPKDKLTLVTADEQTGGKGQFGRTWISPPMMNLYTSFCFFIDENQKDPLSLTHVLALAVIDILENLGVEGRLKWPNDIMVKDKKIAGILCETQHLPPQFGVVIGMGLNINMTAEFLKSINQPATSLFAETGKENDLDEILKELTKRFVIDLERFLKEGFNPFLNKFREKMNPKLK